MYRCVTYKVLLVFNKLTGVNLKSYSVSQLIAWTVIPTPELIRYVETMNEL